MCFSIRPKNSCVQQCVYIRIFIYDIYINFTQIGSYLLLPTNIYLFKIMQNILLTR